MTEQLRLRAGGCGQLARALLPAHESDQPDTCCDVRFGKSGIDAHALQPVSIARRGHQKQQSCKRFNLPQAEGACSGKRSGESLSQVAVNC